MIRSASVSWLDRSAWLLLIALLFVAPLGHTLALRSVLSLSVLSLLPVYLLCRKDDWIFLSLFLPWAGWVFLSATWSPQPGVTLVDGLWNVLSPLAVFFVARKAAVVRPLILPVAAYFSSLSIILIAGVAAYFSGAAAMSTDPRGWSKLYPGPGYGSTFAVMGVTVGIWLLMGGGGGPRRAGRIFGGLVLAVSMVLGILSQNRMYWVSVCVVVLPWVLGLVPRRSLWKTVTILAGFAVLVVVGLVIAFGIRNGVSISSITSATMGEILLSDPRWFIWHEWLSIGERSPWWGRGFGSRILSQIGGQYLSPAMARVDNAGYSHAHNLFLNVWIQTGLIGLAGFFLMLGTVLFRAGKAAFAAPHPSSRVDALAAISLLLGCLSKAMTDYFFFGPAGLVMWIYLGLFLRPIPDKGTGPAGNAAKTAPMDDNPPANSREVR